MVKVIFHTIRNCSGSQFSPLSEVPILKREAIEENRCLIQQALFDVRNFFNRKTLNLISQINSNCCHYNRQEYFIDILVLIFRYSRYEY